MSLRYLGVRPEGTKAVKLEDVAVYAKGEDPAKTAYAAIKEAAKAGEPEEPAGPGAPVRPGSGQVRVPELTGLPVREAVQAILSLGLIPVVEGSGRLERSEPPAGSALGKGAELTLVFEPST
jgi:cell division protein FtsI (penicillin-binding protein 3)